MAEQKYRPLKKALQQTFKRIAQAARMDALPDKREIEEFGRQIETMVSYPGFGDEAYPEIVAASRQLAGCWAGRNIAGLKHVLAEIVALKNRCHAARGLGQGAHDQPENSTP